MLDTARQSRPQFQVLTSWRLIEHDNDSKISRPASCGGWGGRVRSLDVFGDIRGKASVGIIFFLICVCQVIQAVRDSRRRKGEESARRECEQIELIRLEWEKSPEGQLYIEQQRRQVAEEQHRFAAERAARREEEKRQRRKAETLVANAEWQAFLNQKPCTRWRG